MSFAQDHPLQFRGRLIAAGDIRNVLDKSASLFIPAHTLQTAATRAKLES